MSQSGIATKFLERAARRGYATAPIKSDRMPPGIPFIVGNEAAERFSFYGMRAILFVFMTKYMVDRSGHAAPMSEVDATIWFHTFVSATYILPFLGGIIADAFFGKYWTVMVLSWVYCAGHATLAINDTKDGLRLGLMLIALGAGGIKPCVSAIVGDQFGPSNQQLLPRIYGWFYFSINSGSAISTLLIPVLLDHYGSHVAFAVPGILMFIATIIFWLGRKKFVHIPPRGVEFLRETFSLESAKVLGRLAILYSFTAFFWGLYDQSSSRWVEQAGKMDLHWLGHTWDASQIQALNPILILVMIPIFSYLIYPTLGRLFTITPLRKISIGFFVAIPAFLVPAWIETQIAKGLTPSIAWQALAYVLMTAAEILISITCLEFAYTQAPRRMKSLIMSFYLGSIGMGDLFVALVNVFIKNPDGTVKLSGANYYLFFTAVLFVSALLFIIAAYFYKEKTFLQEEQPASV